MDAVNQLIRGLPRGDADILDLMDPALFWDIMVQVLGWVAKQPFCTLLSSYMVTWCSTGRLPLVELPEVCGVKEIQNIHYPVTIVCRFNRKSLEGEPWDARLTGEFELVILVRARPLKSWQLVRQWCRSAIHWWRDFVQLYMKFHSPDWFGCLGSQLKGCSATCTSTSSYVFYS